jgi:16S rRNA (guanine527-N7)-methyltransferase
MQQQHPTLPNLSDVWQKTLEWQPSQQQQQQFQQLYEQILTGNRQFNLTRITEIEDFWEKHLWDSLAALKSELNSQKSLKIIDIGTGAGFPGLPVAIALPTSHVTLLDSTRKKTLFLSTVITQLNLNNVTTLTARVEAIGQEKSHREQYDLALIRAVAEAAVCAEYALPLLKIGGKALLYRGHWQEQDSSNLQSNLKQLGGKLEAIEPLTTPLTKGIRHCLNIRKIASTRSQFPRSVGIPTQQPLS